MTELSKRNVLVVDDSPQIRRILVKILKDEGCQRILQANDGRMALAMLQDSISTPPQVDLILLDWNMPKMTGVEFLTKIRKDPAFKKTPVVMITAEAQTENVVAAVKAGVNSYVIKPFNPDQIIAKLNQVIE